MEGTPKVLKSAYDSPTFGEDASFRLDKPVGSASISPCGRDIVLASRQGLHIIDLDSPYSPPRHLPHHTPWEVADVQWSPFAARDSWVVSTSNQKALLWNLEMKNARSSIEHVLHAHSRAITDINFSAHHPDILATCAVDSFVHCWDIRQPARPVISFCDWFAGATQVKWNRQDSHILASSHDKLLRIWDDRKGAYPLRSIVAHATKIYGVDWNRAEPRTLVTCSLDRTIKFWDYSDTTEEPREIINTPFPVWRARHTPFGFGLLAMPQRGDYDLHLYDRRSLGLHQKGGIQPPVYSFEGHDDQVKEFLWRTRGTIAESVDNREFQLVSWGSDKVLRLHQVNEEILDKVGYKQGTKAKPHTTLTRKDATYKTFREDGIRPFSVDASIPGNSIPLHPLFRRTSSAGMSKGPGIERGLWGTGQARSMVIMRNKGMIDMDPISWMKGVKIGKRDASPLGMHRSLSSVLPLHLASDRTWERFESLGEEITHVGQRFGKVTFHEIDMLNRVIVLSLVGPWGSAGNSSWIKCHIQFPDSYPLERPRFAVKESPNTTDQQVAQLSNDIELILAAYLGGQRNSLEAVILYLLGESDLDHSLLWLRTRMNSELDVPHNSAESSSDEDDRLDTNDALTASNTQYNVPLPKACGALWADDGRLVCFFPRRLEKLTSLVDTLSLKFVGQMGRFEGFGRLDQGLLAQKRPPTANTAESGDSDFEDSSSSSDTSRSSDGIVAPGQLFMPSMAWHGGPSEGPPEQSVDEMHGSIGAVWDTESGLSSNYLSIHDCHDVLPFKQSLARRYILFAEPQTCCAYNSRVAAEDGAQDVADVWSLVELILKKEVPLDIMQHPHSTESILVAARRAARPLRMEDSAIDLSYDMAEDVQECASVKWGEHPFGSRWLVDSLFQYFENLADTQMLGMLSCVLSEGFRHTNDLSHQIQRQRKGQNVSDLITFGSYIPSAEMAHELFDLQSTEQLLDPELRKGPRKYPTSSIAISGKGQSMSLLRNVPQSNSNRASTFAASLSRSFSFNHAASPSPPSQPRKPLSPAGSHLGTPGVSWGTTSFFGGEATITGEDRHIYSLSVSDAEDHEAPARAPVFKIKLKNQHHFPDDGYADLPLLDPEKSWLHRAYREAYAHMLFVWDMPIQRCEILKYNNLPGTVGSITESSALAIGKATRSNNDAVTQEGLSLRSVCSVCDTAYAHGGEVRVCRKCYTPKMPLICLFCNSIIRGLASPCLSCGHTLHPSCRALLFAQQSSDEFIAQDTEGEETCISGCGCRCSDHTVVEFADPRYEIRKDSTGADTTIAAEEETDSRQNQTEVDEEHAWQDVVYESLSRTLTPKSSQIWRGGEDGPPRSRKKSVGSSLRNEESYG